MLTPEPAAEEYAALLRRRRAELAPHVDKHIPGQHVVSRVVLHRFGWIKDEVASLKLARMDLHHLERRPRLTDPKGCSKVENSGVAETSVYVGADFRGRGVGKSLLLKQVTAADEGRLWTLQSSVFPENRASLALHHAAGFRTLGVRERVAQHYGVSRDTVMIECRRSTD